MTDSVMTKGERIDLQRLIRQRDKSAARQRSTELLADLAPQLPKNQIQARGMFIRYQKAAAGWRTSAGIGSPGITGPGRSSTMSARRER